MASKQVAKLQGANLARGAGHTPGGAAALAAALHSTTSSSPALAVISIPSTGVSPVPAPAPALAVAGPVVITIPSANATPVQPPVPAPAPALAPAVPIVLGPLRFGRVIRLGFGGYGSVFHYRTENGDQFARKYFKRSDSLLSEAGNINRRTLAIEFSPDGLIRGSGNVIESIGDGREMAPDLTTGIQRMHRYLDYPLALGDLGAAATTKLTKYFAEKIDIHNMILDCVCGLEFLHTKARITHNDIKCGNILMFREGGRIVCKLGDLGICTVIKDSKEKAGVYKPPLSTRGWMAPELYNIEHEVPLPRKIKEDGTPGKIDYNEVGKVDMFSMGLALLYVIDGSVLFKLPTKVDEIVDNYIRGRGGRHEDTLWDRAVRYARAYYDDEFVSVMPVGKYVNRDISRNACLAISLMCMVDPAQRISATECIEMLMKDMPSTITQAHTDSHTTMDTQTTQETPDIKPDIGPNIIDLDKSVSAVSVAISAMAISNTTSPIQTSNSVVRPKRKANIPPAGFSKKQKRARIPTPPGAIVIGDSTSASSSLPTIGDTNSPQVKKAKHTNAANANAANANAASANAQPAPTRRELIVRLLKFMRGNYSGESHSDLKYICPSEFQVLLDELYVADDQKGNAINEAAKELFDVLQDMKNCEQERRKYFHALTNRGKTAYDRLLAKRNMAKKN